MRFRIVLLLALPVLLAAKAPLERVDLQRLERLATGWSVAEAEESGDTGSVTVERVVWPVFYVHWMPLEKGASKLTADEAVKVVEHLWKDLVIDGPLEPREMSFPAHPGYVIETTTSNGEMQTRYYVWACPDSGRIIVVDASASTLATVPPDLMPEMAEMARSVQCHAGGKFDVSDRLATRRDIPDVEISYSHPDTWTTLVNYRVQEEYLGWNFAISMPAATRESGQDVALEVDAYRRLHFSWGPIRDFPMSYDVLRQTVEDYWRERARNVMIYKTYAYENLWIAEGMAAMGPDALPAPPARFHKFRAWMWTGDEEAYFAIAHVGAVHLGRHKLNWSGEMWSRSFDEMLAAVKSE